MWDPPTLDRYADLVLRSCLAVHLDDTIAIHGEPAHNDLIVALAAGAYRLGAGLVDVQFVEPRVRRARVVEASDEGLARQPAWAERRMRDLVAARGASISINGPSEPFLLNGVDPARSVRERTTRVPGQGAYLQAVMANRLRFCVISYPLPGWARTAYPDVSPQAAADRVAEDLSWFCRIGPLDGAGAAAWEQHVDRLSRRAATLTALALDRVELRGPGTDLVVGLAPGAAFLSADERTIHGDRFRANLPTEEVFTSPDPRRVDGTFRCTRPLTLDGRRITGITGRITGGRLVSVSADDPGDRDFLAGYLARDPGAGRLGELALVDATSRIGQSGRTYGITLLDENAVSHVAFGSGFDASRPSGGRRVNRSAIHVDVMIGAPDVDVTGVAGSGVRVPLIADGLWQGELA